MCHGELPASTEKRLGVFVFLATDYIACGQIRQRFLSFTSLAALFSVLMPSTLLDASDDELFAAAALLAKQYDADISPDFSRADIVISVKLWFPVVHEVDHI